MPFAADAKLKPAPVRLGLTAADCDFYHTVDIPGHGLVKGQWDLRGREADYLGAVPLQGRSVLEIGPASGYLSFWMEQQGADVTALDLSEDHKWDFVPFKAIDIPAANVARKTHLQRLHNSWWFLRQAMAARAQVAYGTVYDLDAASGRFDVVTLNSVLLHLRDPMGALMNAASVCGETLVVTDVAEEHYSRFSWLQDKRAMRFLPRLDRPGGYDAWFMLPSGLVADMMQIMGFKTTITKHRQAFEKGVFRMYTVVGERV